ncbi:unnamed protein product [Cuscuta campestris]|uniref:Uncharacterized protein n=1 Tax=Cuscuta campestris TaxID=132261 RepID=A0A484KS96_9ASTE|nr:unnamed protein product [Cuscuta campestris]
MTIFSIKSTLHRLPPLTWKQVLKSLCAAIHTPGGSSTMGAGFGGLNRVVRVPPKPMKQRGAGYMEFEEFVIPDDQPAGETGGSQANPTKTFPVNQETVEILDEDEPQDNRSKGKEKEKTGRRTKKVATNHPSTMNKRQRIDPGAAHQTVEEAYINLGLRLREVGEIGAITADRLGMDSPTEVARLKKRNEELALLIKSQTDELAKLSKMAGSLGAENTRLKEENGQLLDEVSETKREMAEKEENFPGRAAA